MTLPNGTCVPVIEHCRAYDAEDPFRCVSCSEAEFFTEHGACVKLQDCLQVNSLDSRLCDVCKEGYFNLRLTPLLATSEQCVRTIPGCALYGARAEICLRCKEGSTLIQSVPNQCLQSVEGCLVLDEDPRFCDQCDSGYFLNRSQLLSY